jgi:hypothetical protein
MQKLKSKMLRSAKKSNLPRVSRRRYAFIGMHPDIGWHVCHRQSVMDGSTIIRIRFSPRRGTNRAFAGYDGDRRRFIVRGYDKDWAPKMRCGWRYREFSMPNKRLNNFKILRYSDYAKRRRDATRVRKNK